MQRQAQELNSLTTKLEHLCVPVFIGISFGATHQPSVCPDQASEGGQCQLQAFQGCCGLSRRPQSWGEPHTPEKVLVQWFMGHQCKETFCGGKQAQISWQGWWQETKVMHVHLTRCRQNLASFPGLPCFRSLVCFQYNTRRRKSFCALPPPCVILNANWRAKMG